MGTIKIVKDYVVDKVAQKLQRETYHFTPDFKFVALIILQGLLPTFEGKENPSDIDSIGGIDEYAKAHNESETVYRAYFDYTLKTLIEVLWDTEPYVRTAAVQKVIESFKPLLQARAEIQIEKERAYAIYDGLDLRTKLLIGVGVELQTMAGVNVDSFDDILFRFCEGELISQARKDPILSKDPDAVYLCELYDKAVYINRPS